MVGVPAGANKVQVLQAGFADAIGSEAALEEIALRAERIFLASNWLPRQRGMGRLRLDLVDREAFLDSQPVNLNPREFALLWRLADDPRKAISKKQLIQDVWRMGFVPETNSIAVHMSRLRRKLAVVGLSDVIETAPEGGYCLNLDVQDGLDGPLEAHANSLGEPTPCIEALTA